jgi:hypothetical protein
MEEEEELKSRKDKTVETGKKLAGEAAEKVRELKESPEFRSIRSLTWLGLGIAVLFLVLMPVDNVNYRWWVMLPLGAAGVLILWKQWASAPEKMGFEAKICLGGLVVLAALVVLRDILLTHSLAVMHDSLSKITTPFKDLEKLMGK